VTDPEEPISVDREDLVEREADVADEFDRPLPDDADEADVIEQKLDVPGADEEDYPS
jgi:hypothetical protein